MTDTTTTAPTTVDQDGRAIITRDDMVARITGWLLAIPETEEGDDTAILAQLAGAQTWDDINAPWQSAKVEKYIDHEIVIRGVRRINSDFDTGFGYYLVCDVVDTLTGEAGTMIAGATAIVGQLAAVHHQGGFPCVCTPRQAKRAKLGKSPAQHLDDVRPA